MKRNLLMSIFLPFLLIASIIEATLCYRAPAWLFKTAPATLQAAPQKVNTALPDRVAAILPPPGYERVAAAKSSFSEWLRTISIKKDKTVYLYNGERKKNQSAQYAVLDIPVGNKDLQQCADAVMRLRAQYLYSQNRFEEIWFSDNAGKKYICPPRADSTRFERYLESVYAMCGTLSLEKQLHPVSSMNKLQPGDVLIKGGSPGHAVMVMDVAINKEGKKLYLLAQSYMPAQDIHVLNNPGNVVGSPWYAIKDANALIFTPEWTFKPTQLRRW